jgi:hypothetical protein
MNVCSVHNSRDQNGNFECYTANQGILCTLTKDGRLKMSGMHDINRQKTVGKEEGLMMLKSLGGDEDNPFCRSKKLDMAHIVCMEMFMLETCSYLFIVTEPKCYVSLENTHSYELVFHTVMNQIVATTTFEILTEIEPSRCKLSRWLDGMMIDHRYALLISSVS